MQCMYVCMHTRTLTVCLCMCMYVCMYIVGMRMYVCMYLCMHVCLYMYIYMYGTSARNPLQVCVCLLCRYSPGLHTYLVFVYMYMPVRMYVVAYLYLCMLQKTDVHQNERVQSITQEVHPIPGAGNPSKPKTPKPIGQNMSIFLETGQKIKKPKISRPLRNLKCAYV